MVLNTALLTVTFNADKLAISGTGTSSHATVTGTKESAQKNRHMAAEGNKMAAGWRCGGRERRGPAGCWASPVLPSPPQSSPEPGSHRLGSISRAGKNPGESIREPSQWKWIRPLEQNGGRQVRVGGRVLRGRRRRRRQGCRKPDRRPLELICSLHLL